MSKRANYCKNCGAILIEQMPNCPDCGIKLSQEDKISVTPLELIVGIFFLVIGQVLYIFTENYIFDANTLIFGIHISTYPGGILVQFCNLFIITGLLVVTSGIAVCVTKCNAGKSIKVKAIIILICAKLSMICMYIMYTYMQIIEHDSTIDGIDSIAELVVFVGIIMYCIGIAQGIIAGAREINTKEGEKNI